MKFGWKFNLLLLCGLIFSAKSQISISGSSTLWKALPGNYDYFADQQTGQPAGDIVGDTVNPGFFTAFDSGTSSTTDGALGFRVRFDAAGGNNNNPQFDRVLWIGIDADNNGSVDVFAGVNRSGSNNSVGIYGAGTGANTSPNTTTISSTAYYSATLSASNYNYRAVTASDAIGPLGALTDVTTNTTGDTDYYLSFSVPFAQIVGFLNQQPNPNISINDSSPLRYVMGSSTQANSLNQDLGGVNGGTNSSSTWTSLGGFTPLITAAGNTPVPETHTALLFLLTTTPLLIKRRR
jgi:hypothetical protein